MSNTNNIPYVIKTNGSVTLYMKGECLTVAPDHPNYAKIIAAIKASEFAKIDALVNVAKAVTSYSGGRIRVENGVVFYGDLAVHNTLTDRVIKMMSEGFKFEHMLKFLENLMLNPSKRALDETYRFLENYGLPITEDGCFLAYKAVRGDYTDIYSGKFNNSIGNVVSMPRNQVDDTYGKDCSHGLHVGALDYVVGYGHFAKGVARYANGNRLLIVKVNPKDVVSVPEYAGHTKMRVCEYTVVSEILDVVKELDKVVYTATAQELVPDRCDGACRCDALDELDEVDYADDADDADDTDEEYIPEGLGDYEEGYKLGVEDINNGMEFQFSLNIDDSDSFKDGYRDGYNENR